MANGYRPDEPVGLCVVGCGQIARAHLKAISELAGRVRLAATVDVDADRARAAADEYGPCHWSTDANAAFAREDVHAALLCLPHDLHHPFALAAARAGLHILCEKPMALDAAQAKEMVDAALAAGVRLMIGHSRRFTANAEQARAVVQSGRLGVIRHISSNLLCRVEQPSTDWRRSEAHTGGFLIPLFGTHLVDLLMWVSGLSVKRVYCEAASGSAAWQGEDEVGILLNLVGDGDSGDSVLCSLHMSTNYRDALRDELIVSGSKGTLRLDRSSLRLDGEKVEVAAGALSNFARQLDEFVRCIVENREPISSGREALAVMRVLDACRHSAQTHVAVDFASQPILM